VNCVTTKTFVIAGLLALTALAAIPAASASDLPTVRTPYCLGHAEICNYIHTCAAPVSGGGGVVGATATYAGEEAEIACEAAKAEAGLTIATATAACDRTLAYLYDSDCSLTCTCDPQPVLDLNDLVTISNDASSPPSLPSADTSSSIVVACRIHISGGGGVVGDTVDYVVDLGNLACNYALGSAFIAAGATIDSCNNTGVYLVGQDNWCTIYVTQ